MAPIGFREALDAIHKFDPAEARDDRGRWTQTGSLQFKRWFGDSKIVDKAGNPLRMYHGTEKDFAAFSTAAINSNYEQSFGFHFSNLADDANLYSHAHTEEGGRVVPVYLSVKNPLVYELHGDQHPEGVADNRKSEIIEQLLEARDARRPYDGVILRNDDRGLMNVVVFKPTQIKSAIGNSGTFNPRSADITKDFDPNEARDPDGRWTNGGNFSDYARQIADASDDDLSDRIYREDNHGGPGRIRIGGAAFASPNTAEGKDLATSINDLGGARQAAFQKAGDDIDAELGLTVRSQLPAVGAWSDGAENSTMTETLNHDPEAIRLSAAMKGALGQQKAVLAFTADEHGPSAMYDMTVLGPPAVVHDELLKAGVPFHTLIPSGNGTRVVVVDTDGSMANAVGDYAVANHTQAERLLGHAEFIGDQEGKGTDAEQRARGQAAYQAAIASSPSRYQGRTPAEIWTGIHSRWSDRLAAIKRALGFGQALHIIKAFNPDQPRDEHGRWAELGDTHGLKATGAAAARDQKAVWIKNSPLKSIHAVYAGADENKRQLDIAAQKVVDATGADYRQPGIKKLPRVLEKDFTAALVKMWAGRDPAGVTDIVRSTFAVTSPDQADAVVKALGEHFPITDEGWKTTEVGYFDRAVNMRFPNGQIGEALIAPPELIQAKSNSGGGGHLMYKAWRKLTDDDPAKEPLAQAQRTLYGAARAKLSPEWHQAMGAGGAPAA